MFQGRQYAPRAAAKGEHPIQRKKSERAQNEPRRFRFTRSRATQMHGTNGRANPIQRQRCQDVPENDPVRPLLTFDYDPTRRSMTFDDQSDDCRSHRRKKSRCEEQGPKPAFQLFSNHRWLFVHHVRGIFLIVRLGYSQINATRA